MNPAQLKQALNDLGKPKILVVGDLMLDSYSYGQVERISPEAPIPVLRVDSEQSMLGGAANTMVNLSTLGCVVSACGATGNDSAAASIRSLLEENHIDHKGVFTQSDCRTILKHRLISQHHHLLRFDHDPPRNWQPANHNEIMEFLQIAVPQHNLVVISDYGKGFVTPLLLNTLRSLTQQHDIPVVVDPKKNARYSDYAGFTAIKPNRKEASEVLGQPLHDRQTILQAAEQLKQQTQARYITISLDKDGMLVYQNNTQYDWIATQAQEVFDVVGAGDMVVAVISSFLACSQPIQVAAHWAMIAAGRAIRHVGVVSLTRTQLLEELQDHAHSKLTNLTALKQYLRQSQKPIIFTNGYFDNFGIGHLKFLHQLKQFDGIRVVAINSDASIQRSKGSKAVLDELERARILAALASVDWVLIFDEDDACNLIEQLAPTKVIKGERYRNQDLPEHPSIQKIGAELVFLPEH